MTTQRKIISRNRSWINSTSKAIKDTLRDDFNVNEMLFDITEPKGDGVYRTEGRFKGGNGTFEIIVDTENQTFEQIS